MKSLVLAALLFVPNIASGQSESDLLRLENLNLKIVLMEQQQEILVYRRDDAIKQRDQLKAKLDAETAKKDKPDEGKK